MKFIKDNDLLLIISDSCNKYNNCIEVIQNENIKNKVYDCFKNFDNYDLYCDIKLINKCLSDPIDMLHRSLLFEDGYEFYMILSLHQLQSFDEKINYLKEILKESNNINKYKELLKDKLRKCYNMFKYEWILHLLKYLDIADLSSYLEDLSNILPNYGDKVVTDKCLMWTPYPKIPFYIIISVVKRLDKEIYRFEAYGINMLMLKHLDIKRYWYDKNSDYVLYAQQQLKEFIN